MNNKIQLFSNFINIKNIRWHAILNLQVLYTKQKHHISEIQQNVEKLSGKVMLPGDLYLCSQCWRPCRPDRFARID